MVTTAPLELVNEAYTLAILSDGSKVVFKINQAFCDTDPTQTEALLATHQVRDYGVSIDNCAKCHHRHDGTPGTQSLSTSEDTFEFYFDGKKCFFQISKPSRRDLDQYPIIELTSREKYEPYSRDHSIRRRTYESTEIAKWRECLGYPTYGVTKHTLENTTQLVTSLQDDTREYLRDYKKTRVHSLRPERINDVMYTDTFFSSLTSIRGFRMFQLFCYKQSKYNVMKLLRRESKVAIAYEDTIIEHGAPNKTVTDNAKALLSDKFNNINRKYSIIPGHTVPYSQHQNYCEGEGGNFKFAVTKCMHYTPHAPEVYWCYCASFLDKVRRHLAKEALSNRSAIEAKCGNTNDISIFRFPWFSPVWYFDPTASFPRDRMSPGFFLDIAENTGDSFSYEILPVKDIEDIPLRKHYPIVRNIVRPRDLDCDVAPLVEDRNRTLHFWNAKGHEFFSEEELNPNFISDRYDDIPDVTEDEIRQLTSDQPSSFSDIRDRDTLTRIDGRIPTIPEEPSEDSLLAVSEEQSTDISSPQCKIPVTTCPNDISVEPARKRHKSSLDHPEGGLLPIISQTQETEDYDSADEYEEDPIPHDCVDNTDDFNELASQINGVYDADADTSRDIEAIINHRYTSGMLELEVSYSTGHETRNKKWYPDKEWHPISLVKNEDAQAVANYVLHNDLGKVMNGLERRWARAFLRALRVTLRRMSRVGTLFESKTHEPNPEQPSRGPKLSRKRKIRMRRAEKKKGKLKSKTEFQYGFEIPKRWEDIIRIDTAAGNKLWQESVSKEVGALLFHECFHFLSSKFKPSKDYQYAHLHFVYAIKPDLVHKSRLVCNGSTVDPRGLSTRATVVKGISVRLLDIIAESQGLRVLTGDVGNAFIQANTAERVYTRVGPEFGEHDGKIALIVKALYGLTTSAERFRTLLADFLRTIGFIPSRYDRDVWMRLRDDLSGYSYICTHVDDFKVVCTNPEMWIDRIASVFLVKSHGPRDYYLGNDYFYHEDMDVWTYGTKTYTKEALARVERIFGCLPFNSTPLPPNDCHPELDESPLLDLGGHRQFQMLIGMLQWLVTIGRPDLCHALTSLNRFGACPREYHLDLAVHIFGYIKRVPQPVICIDSKPLEYERTAGFSKIYLDFLQDYPESYEEVDANLPQAFGPVLETTIMVDSDHGHDKKTFRSLTGLIAWVGSTPVIWFSRRQGAIASSTYAAEFSALRTATEETISLRYMLRCLGCNVPSDGSCPTKIFGDNLGVIQSAANPAADLSKKHVAISFHCVREAIAARILEPYWIPGEFNIPDICTKQIPKTPFCTHCDFLFWRPDFHYREHNRLEMNYEG